MPANLIQTINSINKSMSHLRIVDNGNVLILYPRDGDSDAVNMRVTNLNRGLLELLEEYAMEATIQANSDVVTFDYNLFMEYLEEVYADFVYAENVEFHEDGHVTTINKNAGQDIFMEKKEILEHWDKFMNKTARMCCSMMEESKGW